MIPLMGYKFLHDLALNFILDVSDTFWQENAIITIIFSLKPMYGSSVLK